ncbi:alpha/beta fold hydrolase [Phenylobacterium sp.]|uniref:alpha/beta fold hydrolase n=1 Tax=Phenylobacterium sp. TaxID=1871053 RepID=UPI003BA8DBA3
MSQDPAAALAANNPADAALELAALLSLSRPMPLRPRDAELLEGADEFRFGPDDSRIAWAVGHGPPVLFVHGWGGRGTQMAGLARAVAADGYRSVFFDAGGHGDSRSEPIGFDTFIRDTSDLTTALGEDVHAWVGHSAGGLGMMAARRLLGLEAGRYVCISAPRFPYVPLETLKSSTGVADEVLDQVKPILATQFQTTWEGLEAGEAYVPDPGRPLLLAYDMDDERVRHADADAIADAWPGAEVLKTRTYGHNRILQAPEVWTGVRTFLREAV